VVSVQGLDRAPQLGTEHPLQRSGRELHRRHGKSQLAERGRHLSADEPHTDEHGLGCTARGLTDGVGIGHRAEFEHPGQLGAGDRQAPAPHAGRDHGLVERHLLPSLELDDALSCQEALGSHPEAGVDRVVLVPARRANPVGLGLGAAQVPP
jgi:hypothetical protein